MAVLKKSAALGADDLDHITRVVHGSVFEGDTAEREDMRMELSHLIAEFMLNVKTMMWFQAAAMAHGSAKVMSGLRHTMPASQYIELTPEQLEALRNV